jgi:hypothetical protein
MTRTRFGPRWLLPVLVLLLVLGHVCELPAYAGLLSHAAHDAHHADHHADQLEMSCDAVDAVSNTSSLHTEHVAEVVHAGSELVPAPIQRVGWPVECSTIPRSRPLLFLLYASLLI